MYKKSLPDIDSVGKTKSPNKTHKSQSKCSYMSMPSNYFATILTKSVYSFLKKSSMVGALILSIPFNMMPEAPSKSASFAKFKPGFYGLTRV